MLEDLTVWITTNCEKFLEMEVPDHLTCPMRTLHAGEEPTIKTTWNNGLLQNWVKVMTRLYIVTLLIQLTCRVHHVKCQAGWLTIWIRDWGNKYQ